tara:strand:- start:224 stop:541 length:318 start_codon:yes stop_codon:yes gene_type:complete
MIKLDYDNISFSTLNKRIEFIKNNPITKSIKIFQSPSCDGFHIYIKPTKELTWNEKIYYRKLFKDDGQRIVLDLLKKEQEKDVLFQMRMRKGIIVKEIFIKEIVN